MPNYKVAKTDTNVLSVTMDDVKAGWRQKFLLRSDAHHDNPDCLQNLELEHLEEAKAEGAGILDFGDLFCAMQGKYDKRSDKSQLRPEHQVTDYLDALVSTAADFYGPYAENFLMLGMGNHESSIREKHETDLAQRMAATMNDRYKTNIPVLGYTGWVWFKFKQNGYRWRQILWYTHGYGGGGPVTEDIIQSSRQRTYIENADIMCSGHVHRSWLQETVRQRVNQHGRIERREGWYVKLPTYKDAYGKGVRGFEVHKGMGPRPVGAWWLEFYCTGKEQIKTRIYKA